MIIALILLGALLVALVRGGRLSNFVHIRIRFVHLLFLPLVLQIVIFSPLGNFLPRGSASTPYVYITSLFIAALVVCLNLHLPGFKFLLAGLLSNLLVILANGGYMPVSMAARAIAGQPAFDGVYNNVVAMTDATPLWFLGDLFPVPRAFLLTNVYSIGDILITVGGVLFIQGALVLPREGAPVASESPH